MAFVVTKDGSILILGRAITGWFPSLQQWQIRLFKTDHTPTIDSVVADFTESTFAGYARKNLDNELWQTPTWEGDRATAQYDDYPLTWDVTAGTETVYGMLLVDLASGVLVAADRFATVRVLDEDGKLGLLVSLSARGG